MVSILSNTEGWDYSSAPLSASLGVAALSNASATGAPWQQCLCEVGGTTQHVPNSHPSAPDENIEAVIALNNLGADALAKGENFAALQLFRRALLLAATDAVRAVHHDTMTTKAVHAPSTSPASEVACGSSELRYYCDSISDDDDSAEAASFALAVVAEGELCVPSSIADANPVPRHQGVSLATSVLQYCSEYDEGLSRTFPGAVKMTKRLISHEEKIATLHYNLGQAHLAQDEMVQASECFGRSLSELGRCQHRKELICSSAALHCLGFASYRLGRLDESLNFYRRALDDANATADATQFLPEDRQNALINVASSLNCVAVVLFHLDHAKHDAECVALLMKCLHIRKSVLGPSAMTNERDAATALNNLGRVHYMLGRYPQALDAYLETLAMRRTLLGPAHLDVAATVYNTGQTLHRLGKNDDAMELYTNFLAAARPVLGPQHRDVAIMLKCMASVHHERGSHEEALRLYSEALEAARLSLGSYHPEVASTLNKLGNLLYEKGRLDDAMRAYGDGLVAERSALEANHPNIAVTLTNIAQIHRVRGESTCALRLYDEVLALQRSRHGLTHPDIALTLSSIALIHYQNGRYEDSLLFYQESMRIYRDIHGHTTDHVDIAGALNSIGLVLFKRGVLSVAMESFRECLRMRQCLLGEVHRDVAVVLYNMATVGMESGNEEEAIKTYDEALRVEKEALGHDHPDVATTLAHIGQVYQDQGMLHRAAEYFEEALQVELKALGPHHLLIAHTLNQLGNLRLQTNNASGAVEAFTEALRIYRRNGLGDDRIVIAGIRMYEMAIVHPECAAAA
uniref:Kinesin light chain n=1 Tax=Odontella aurita TaxID=265563 RepID=A0A7S4MCA4_9STRA|mmetsp:Transcript_17191/g.49785  ORF Transcript_17191/g.49785 Transcript_17191/m.49785 type:complete len:804 (+) Transcript_17191:80-2491(+)